MALDSWNNMLVRRDNLCIRFDCALDVVVCASRFAFTIRCHMRRLLVSVCMSLCVCVSGSESNSMGPDVTSNECPVNLCASLIDYHRLFAICFSFIPRIWWCNLSKG